MLIDMKSTWVYLSVVQKVNEFRVKACMICINVGKYKEYLSEVSAFINKVANRGGWHLRMSGDV
jgi:hypothetical protein